MRRELLIVFKSLALFSLLIIVSASFAQETKSKPKIGLVLSGGGAKGLAHIGVLKVLEEAGIKPDIITGTSMGSIVGGLYAAGYTVDELIEINENADWIQLLNDSEQLLKIAMQEKSESNKYLFEFPIKDKKINLPAGLIEGQNLEAYFSELFWPLTSNEDFNKLPIPFHCMSVDMISGKTIEHQSGNLVESIRASMSIPTVFSPVEMDTMLLMDGGVTRNLPVQEAIDMGADIIIAVYVGYEEDVKAEDLTSMTDILQRSIALAGIVDAKAQIPKCDIFIAPELGEYGASDFAKNKIIQQLGEDAARRKMDEIKALAKKYNLTLGTTPKIEQPKRILIRDIEVENIQYLSEDFVLSKSGIERGDSVTYNNIREAIEYMHGTRYFSKLTFSLKKTENEEGYVLVFHVKENPRAMFKFSPLYDNDLGVGMVMNFTLRNIIMPSSRFLLSVNVAENPGLNIVLDNKLGKSQRFSDQVFLNAQNYKLSFYDEGESLGNYHMNYFNGGYGIFYAPGLNNQLGIKGFYRFNKLTPNSDFRSIYAEADFNKLTTHEWGYDAFYKLNTTDDLYFPKKGMKLEVSFTHALSTKSEMDLNTVSSDQEYFINETDDAYATLCIDHNWYKTFAERFTCNLGLGIGLNTDNPGINGMFMLGGIQYGDNFGYRDFAGYNFAELYTQNYAFVKSALNVEIAPGLYLSGTVNVGNMANASLDLLDNIVQNSISDYYWGYNFGVKYNSLLGPVHLLVSDNNKDGETRFHFSIGFPF
jgi:NTE family protein